MSDIEINPNTELTEAQKNLLNGMKNAELLNQLFPVIDSISNNSVANPAELLNNLMRILRTLMTPLQVLEDMKDIPVIGELVGVLCEILGMMFKLYSMQITLHLMHFRGMPFGYDSAVQAYKNIDINKIGTESAKVKSSMATTSDANNPDLTNANIQASGMTDASYLANLAAVQEFWNKTTLEAFLEENKNTFKLLGIEYAFLEPGTDPTYIQFKAITEIMNKLNEAIAKVSNARETIDSDDYLKNKSESNQEVKATSKILNG